MLPSIGPNDASLSDSCTSRRCSLSCLCLKKLVHCVECKNWYRLFFLPGLPYKAEPGNTGESGKVKLPIIGFWNTGKFSLSDAGKLLSIFSCQMLEIFSCPILESFWKYFLVRYWKITGNFSLSDTGNLLEIFPCPMLEICWKFFLVRCWRFAGSFSLSDAGKLLVIFPSPIPESYLLLLESYWILSVIWENPENRYCIHLCSLI